MKKAWKDTERLVGESGRAYKRRVVSNVAVAIAAIIAAVQTVTPEETMQVEDALDAWMAECRKVQNDPGYVPKFGTASADIRNDTMQFASAFDLLCF